MSSDKISPIVDIVIRTYSKDLEWLKYSLQSIYKFCSGFRNIIIIIPEKQKHLLDALNLTQEKIFTCPDYKDDYLGQQITKICADQYSDADYIMFGDSDTLITQPLKPEYLFREDKPIILKTSYEKIGNTVPWKSVTQKALGFDVQFEFMRRHPFLYRSDTLKEFRAYMKQLHGKEVGEYINKQPDRAFSEFNAIGAFADKFEHDKYYFQDTETEPLPPLYVRQFWSWGGITNEVLEELNNILKQEELDHVQNINGRIAFEGDSYIGAELIKLRDKFGIKYCIETGTQYGATTKSLKGIFEKIISIEADKEFLEMAKQNIADDNVILMEGKSEDVLKDITHDNSIYYLDAHGCNIGGCPLKQELEIIGSKNYKNVSIAIHDFKVPDKDFGFDEYDYELKFEEIEKYLHIIYPDGFDFNYNEKADGAYRGIIYIYPKHN